jgi:regulator of sigma E protease
VSAVWFILLIGVLITVHELGHLVAARLLGVGVVKVSIGFGPTLASLKRGRTEYAVSLIPLGGYVRLVGEEGDAVAPEDRARAFALRPTWQRLIVILAGPAANLIFPIFIFTHLYIRQDTARSAVIGTVLDGQPAREADLRVSDRVVAVDDEPVQSWDELNRHILASPGRELRITVERPGQERPLTKVITPRPHLRTDAFGVRERVGLIGVAPHFRLPQIGVLDENSAAARAGLRSFDLITSIQGREVATAADLDPILQPRAGGMIVVTYLRPETSSLGFAGVARLQPGAAQIVPQLLPTGRYETGLRPADLFVYTVEAGTPAAALGLRAGDVLTALDGVKLTSWELFQQALEEHPDAEHTLAWRAAGDGGAERSATFHLQPRREIDEYQAEATSFVFGASTARAVRPVPDVPLEPRFAAAVGQAIARAISVTGTLVRVLGLTVLGRLPGTAIGGPILIYHVAGVAAQHGAAQFLVMAALISLNLGLLNLLPVPLLDGGQATLVILEAVRRRPVSRRARDRARVIGVALLLALLLLASRNDLMRHFGR